MDKKFISIVLILLFSINPCTCQFNTVRNFPAIKKTNEPFTDALKADSLEWINEADSTDVKKQADSISKVEESVNISLPLKHIEITSAFGYRVHPVEKVTMFHAGIDLKAYYEPFYCFADGIVVRTGHSERSGNYVVINHGKLETIYCHLSQVWVKEEDSVSGGQMLGITGNTGNTSGPHLHFGMRWEGSPVNPEKIILFVMNHQII